MRQLRIGPRRAIFLQMRYRHCPMIIPCLLIGWAFAGSTAKTAQPEEFLPAPPAPAPPPRRCVASFFWCGFPGGVVVCLAEEMHALFDADLPPHHEHLYG